MKKSVLLILILSVAVFLFAGSGTVIDINDSVYSEIDDLALLNGYSKPSTGRPWTVAQATLELERIVLTNSQTQQLRERIESYLKDLQTEFFDVGIAFNPELYIHTNTESFTMEDDWVYGFATRNPFATLSLDASLGVFSTYCELAYGWGKTTYRDNFDSLASVAAANGRTWVGLGAVVPQSDTSTYIVSKSWLYSKAVVFNFPDIDKIEIEVPRRAYLSVASENVSLSIGRDRLSWGGSSIGNFIFDDGNERQDYLSFKAFGKKYGFDYVAMFLEQEFGNTFNETLESNEILPRVFLAHRFYYRPFDWMQIEASENVMCLTDTMGLSEINPAYIYHQLNNSSKFNAIAHAEVDMTVASGFRFWFQFVLDQATAPTEDDSQDPAWGLSGGFEYARLLGGGILDLKFEGLYANPALYRRGMVDFIIWNRYSTNHNEAEGIPYRKVPFYSFLGLKYGGDTTAALLSASWLGFDGLDVSLEGLLVANGGFTMFDSHNSGNDNTDIPNRHLKGLSGDITYTGHVSLDASYDFVVDLKRFELNCKASAGVAFAFKGNASDVQLNVGLGILL